MTYVTTIVFLSNPFAMILDAIHGVVKKTKKNTMGTKKKII